MSQYQKYPPVGGGGGGGSGTVTSVGLLVDTNIFTLSGTNPITSSGTFVLELAPQVGNVVLASPSDGSSDIPSFRKLVLADLTAIGNSNSIAGFNNSGDLESIPGFFIDTVSNGLNIGLTEQPNGGNGGTVHNFSVSFDPLQNSPNENWNILNAYVDLDVNSSGFSQGTSGGAAQLLNLTFNHQGTGSVGRLTYINMNSSLGNGTDPITIKGMSYSNGFTNINTNVTMDGSIQGYGFQPNMDAAAASTSNLNIQAFYDYSNIAVPVYGYTSFGAGPAISSIANNNNYNGVFLNPNIASLVGNAGFFGFSIVPQIGTMSATGSLQGVIFSPSVAVSHGQIVGVNISPNVASGDAQFQGLTISPSGAASFSSVQGISINLSSVSTGDAQGATGLSSDSRLSVNAETTLRSAQGFQIGNRVESLFHIPSGSPVTGTDSMGNNFAGDLMAEDDLALGPIGLGWGSVGFIADLAIAATKTVDTVNVFLPAVALPDPGFATGGHVNNMSFIRMFAPLSQGGTITIDNLYAVKLDSIFGDFGLAATNAWGLYIDSDTAQNYIGNSLALGSASKKVTNSSIGIEVGNKKAIRPGQVTTVEKLALTAVAGMLVYDTTLNQMSYYNGTTWINF